jgi:hypothetical protein
MSPVFFFKNIRVGNKSFTFLNKKNSKAMYTSLGLKAHTPVIFLSKA